MVHKFYGGTHMACFRTKGSHCDWSTKLAVRVGDTIREDILEVTGADGLESSGGRGGLYCEGDLEALQGWEQSQ